MNQHEVAEILAKPISQELLGSPIPARLACTAVDGDPRVVPVGFQWTGDQLVVCTPTAAAKVRALRQTPRVAITIDTEANPSKVLLVRGSAQVEVVDGKAVQDLVDALGDPR